MVAGSDFAKRTRSSSKRFSILSHVGVRLHVERLIREASEDLSRHDVCADIVYNTVQEVTGTAHFVSLAEFLHLGPYSGILFSGPVFHGFLLRVW